MTHFGNTGRRWILCFTCFTSGGCILVMELCGVRLLAPVFGNAVNTWTSLIGMILLAVALGDFLGGWLIDKTRSPILIPALLLFAATYLVVTFLSLDLVMSTLAYSYAWGPIFGALILFFFPALLLSCITPVSVRLFSLTSGDQSIGLSSGTIGMCSTLGSFIGTILAGFYIIPYTDIEYIMLYLSILLTALAVLFSIGFGIQVKQFREALFFIAFIVTASFLTHNRAIPGLVYLHTTSYQRILITDRKDDSGLTVRLIQLDSDRAGAIHLEDGSLVFKYQKYWPLMPAFTAHINKVAFLGGGAFGVPRQMSVHFPKAQIDVVEIDPILVSVANKYFSLNQFSNIHSYGIDARWFLATSPNNYDAIYGDCYNGAASIPPHLLTKQFFQVVKNHLTPHGIFMMNLIAAVQGNRSGLYKAVMTTLATSFPHLRIFAAYPERLDMVQNLEVLASVNDFQEPKEQPGIPDFAWILKTEIPVNIPIDTSCITDTLNPVDALTFQQWLN